MEDNDMFIVLGVSEASGNRKNSFRRPSSKGKVRTKRLPHKVSSLAGKKQYLTKVEREANHETKKKYLEAVFDFYGRFQPVKNLKMGLNGVRWREVSPEEEEAFRKDWKGEPLTSSKSKLSSPYQTHNNNHARPVRAIWPCFGPGYFIGADHNFYSPLEPSDAQTKLEALVEHTRRGFLAIDSGKTSTIKERIKCLQANYSKDCLQIYNKTHDDDINALVDYIYFADESTEFMKRAKSARKAKIGDCHDVGLPSTTAIPPRTPVSSLTLSPKDAELSSNYSSRGTYTSENQPSGRTDNEQMKCGHSQDHKFKLARASNGVPDDNNNINKKNYGDDITEDPLNDGITEDTLNDGKNCYEGHHIITSEDSNLADELTDDDLYFILTL